jgi:hypothetical protein
MFDITDRYDEKQRQAERDLDDADRAAALTAECPICQKSGMVYVLDSAGDPGYRCTACKFIDWI